jgi:phosphoadenosine phosphosulfate reductase
VHGDLFGRAEKLRWVRTVNYYSCWGLLLPGGEVGKMFEAGQMSNDLFTGQSKTQIAIERLKAFCPPEGYYVAFSGGKDSIVILDLVKRSGCKYDAHYNITGIDPPELYYFIRDNFPEVERHRPEITIWKLIAKKMMPPTRKVRYCCEYLKERGGIGRYVVTGVRAKESTKRSKRRMIESCYKTSNKKYVNPIIDWSDGDVWKYIKNNDIKYCNLYDEGFKRLGCIGCPMAGSEGRRREFNRWPSYEKKYRKAFEQAAKARIENPSKNKFQGRNYLKWNDGNDMFDWWMQDNHQKGCPDQTVMFE